MQTALRSAPEGNNLLTFIKNFSLTEANARNKNIKAPLAKEPVIQAPVVQAPVIQAPKASAAPPVKKLSKKLKIKN